VFENELTIVVDRPALDVYRFLATPANYVGLHPGTAGISGTGTDSVCGAGAMWRERVARPDGRTFDADWLAVAAEPRHRWVFRSVQFGGRPIQVTIAYTLDAHTTVTRTMTTVAADYAAISAAERATYTDARLHEAVLTNLKNVLSGH
jgi:hypothetical protein